MIEQGLMFASGFLACALVVHCYRWYREIRKLAKEELDFRFKQLSERSSENQARLWTLQHRIDALEKLGETK